MTTITPRVWTVTVPSHGHELLTSNQRLHWAKRAQRAKAWRSLGWIYAVRCGLPRTPAARPRRVHVLVEVASTDRRRRDVHNVMPTVKAIVDGLVDAGFLADDNDAHLVGPDLRPAPDLVAQSELRFTITEEADQ